MRYAGRLPLRGYGQDPVPPLQMPPPCDDPVKLRAMLIAAGQPIPDVGEGWTDESGKDTSADLAVYAAFLQFAVAHGLTPEQSKNPTQADINKMCTDLVAASGGAANGNGKLVVTNGNGWWSQQSQGTKIAIGVGGAAAVGLAIYLVIK